MEGAIVFQISIGHKFKEIVARHGLTSYSQLTIYIPARQTGFQTLYYLRGRVNEINVLKTVFGPLRAF